MRYVFGSYRNTEILQVLTDTGTDMRGFQQLTERTPDAITDDSFRIVRKLRTETFADGTIRDWYEIDRHNRTIDNTPPLKAAQADADALSVNHEIRLAMLEHGLT